MEVSDQEHDLLEFLREEKKRDDTCLLLVDVQNGAWTVSLSTMVGGTRLAGKGTGTSFAEAWERVGPVAS